MNNNNWLASSNYLNNSICCITICCAHWWFCAAPLYNARDTRVNPPDVGIGDPMHFGLLLSISHCFFPFPLRQRGSCLSSKVHGLIMQVMYQSVTLKHTFSSPSPTASGTFHFPVLHWAGTDSEGCWPATCSKWHYSTLCIISSIPSPCLLVDLVVRPDDLLCWVTYRTPNKITLSYASTRLSMSQPADHLDPNSDDPH